MRGMSQDLKNATPAAPSGGVPWGWIAFSLLSLFVIVFFAWKLSGGAGQSFITYYLTVDEYVSEQEKYEGLNLKIAGNVQAESLQQPEQNLYRFVVEYKGKSFPIEYRGFAPDTFKEGAEVVVEGVANSSDVFVAKNLMAKCASKYEAGGPMMERPYSSPNSY